MELNKSILKQTYAEDNAVGGNLNRAFIALLGDAPTNIAGFTHSNGRVTALSANVGSKMLIEAWTREDGITFPAEAAQTERGAGRVTTQTANLIIKKQGSEWREAVREIMNCNGFVVLIPNNRGEIEIGGIYDRLDTTFLVGKGMRPSTTRTEDAAFADENSVTLTLVGETREHGGLLFGSTDALATNIATLEGYLITEGSS